MSKRLSFVVGSIAAVALLAPAGASAVVISPNTTADEFNSNASACSLREAIESANTDSAANADGCPQGSGADEIRLQGGARYEISLPGAEGMNVSGDLDIRLQDLTITAPAQGATIDGNGLTTNDRVIEVANFAPPINVTISNVTITDGGGPQNAPLISGSGIAVFGATQAHVVNLNNVTITGNRGIIGGGMQVGNVGTANLRNVTVNGNTATVDGGGISSDGTVNLFNTTVSNNTANVDGDFIGGGGGLNPDSDVISVKNSIVAGNTDGGQGTKENECVGAGALTSQGSSVIGIVAPCTYNATTGDIPGVASPGLDQLSNNGGPVPTQRVLPSSPALNKGVGCEPSDARGLARTMGGACDIGAYELVLCGKQPVNIIGTEGADKLTGSATNDGILGMGGKDVLKGLAGNDGLCGGKGKDTLKGGKGNDRLVGGKGKDKCVGGKGKKDRNKSCEKGAP